MDLSLSASTAGIAVAIVTLIGSVTADFWVLFLLAKSAFWAQRPAPVGLKRRQLCGSTPVGRGLAR